MRRLAIRNALFGASLLGALALAATAPAQQRAVVEPEDEEAAVSIEYETERPSRFEIDFMAGASNFTANLGDATNIGPAFGARIGYSLFRSFSISAAYLGTVNSASGGGGIDNNSLQTHGITGQLRIAPLNFIGISPYAFVGVGGLWVGRAAVGDVTASFRSGWAGQTPVGGGLIVSPTRFMSIAAESSFVFLWDRGFSPGTMAPGSTPHMWNVLGSLNFFL